MRTILTLLLFMALATAMSAAAETYAGNGNTGFGGPIGGGELAISNTPTQLDFSLTRGAGDLNDWLVIYIDSRSGGFSSSINLSDQSDDGRGAVSGLGSNGTADVNLPFEADFAIAFSAASGGFLFELAEGGNGSLIFIAQLGGGGENTTSEPVFTFSTSLSDLAIGPRDSFRFVGTYLNEPTGFRSDEGFGNGLPPGNPGVPSTVTFSNAQIYGQPAVPSFDGWGLTLLVLLMGSTGASVAVRRNGWGLVSGGR